MICLVKLSGKKKESMNKEKSDNLFILCDREVFGDFIDISVLVSL